MSHRLERILKLMSLLQSGRPYNALQLAQETAVHRRTVFRDVALLRSSGIPIRFDTDTACYSLVGEAQFIAEGLRAHELSRCLQMACLGNFLLRGNFEIIGRAVHRLAAGLPDQDRAGIEQLLRHCRLPVEIDTGQTEILDNEVLVTIARAIRLQHQLMLTVNEGNRDNRPLRMNNPKLVFATRGITVIGQTQPEGRTVELKLSAIREASAVDAAVEARRHDTFSPMNYAAPRDPPTTA